jgi:hypothetical protein
MTWHIDWGRVGVPLICNEGIGEGEACDDCPVLGDWGVTSGTFQVQ